MSASWRIAMAAMDETAAERQLTQWQATVLVWGGLSWGPTNQLLLDAAIDYLGDCRDVRRAAVDRFVNGAPAIDDGVR